MGDPIEAIIEAALERARIPFERHNQAQLDFYLPRHDVHIEVKQFYTPRADEQMSRAPNVIVIQGRAAADAWRASKRARKAAGALKYRYRYPYPVRVSEIEQRC